MRKIFTEIYNKYSELYKETPCTDGLTPELYLRECRTIHMSGPRQSGRTTWLCHNTLTNNRAILIVRDDRFKTSAINNTDTSYYNVNKERLASKILTVEEFIMCNFETLKKIDKTTVFLFDDADTIFPLDFDPVEHLAGLRGNGYSNMTIVMMH